MSSVFPSNPSIGDVYNNYEWNGVAWKFIGYEKINDYAPKDSPAITGIASLPSQTTIGIVEKNEIEKLHGLSGDIATTSYVQAQIAQTLAGLTGGSVTFTYPTIDTPSGTVLMFAGLSAPFGYLLCDGSAVSRTSYASLFTAIGTIHGAGNGSTTFNLPNLKGKIAAGIDSTQTEFDTLGKTGGAKSHTHTNTTGSGESGSHSHTTTDHSHNTADHSHYSDHSHYADHSHYINPGSTGTSSDSHSHGTAATGSTAIQATTGSAGGAPSRNHTHNTNSDSHSHTVNIATFLSANANGSGVTTGNSNYGNTSGANAGNTTSGASTGNTTDTEASHTHTVSTSDSTSNIQPYIVLNYIIKT